MPHVVGRALGLCTSAGAVGLILTAAAELRYVNTTTIALVLVLAVLCIALTRDWLEALVAAIVAGLGLDYFFLPPRGFGMDQPEHWVALLVFLVTALAAGQLSARANRHRTEAIRRRAEIEQLYRLSDAISERERSHHILEGIGEPLQEILGLEAVALYDQATGRVSRSGMPAGQLTDDQLRAVATSGYGFSDLESGVSILPIWESGELAGSLGVAGTVSKGLLKAAAEKVGAAIARIRAAERVKEASAARRSDELRFAIFDALAHEAKGPLNSINIAATTMLSERPGNSAQQREMLSVISEEAGRINRWIDEALRTSRMGSSPPTLNKAPREVREMVSGAIDPLLPRVGPRRISIEIPESLPAADCDAGMIGHVLNLLLDNALKYSPPGSPIAIKSSLDDGAGMIVISVADAGPGVPEDEQPRIFEKQYRGSKHCSSVSGTGLGLASAKHLVEAHGGEIWVTNRPTGGASFSFSLPVAIRVAT
jgi:two-component system, OmpR family, sensor histidine kinase KdpD